MKLYTLRLVPGQDLRIELQKFAKDMNIQAGSIVTCVGALQPSVLRMAGATPTDQPVKTYSDKFEIVSLVGTITADDCHLHVALSGKDGQVVGGHLKEGSLVDLTAEIVIAEDESVVYKREMDAETGFVELVVAQQ